MRLRVLGALAVLALAVTMLTACRTNVGVAARVSGAKITESDVNNYVSPAGVDPSVSAAAAAQNQKVEAPRVQVLSVLVQQDIYAKTLHYLRVPFTATSLAATHDDAAATLLNLQLTGTVLDKELSRELVGTGVKASLQPVFQRMLELEYLIITSRHLTELAQLVAVVRQAGITVSVNPRYGAWDANQLTLASVRPDFLTPQPTPAAAPAG